MKLTPTDASALAYLLHRVRPDWPVKPVEALLLKQENLPPLGAVVVAAMTKAAQPHVGTPALIFTPGDHWPAEAKPALPRAEPCPDHTYFDAYNCRECWAEIKAGQRRRDMLGKHWVPAPEEPEPVESRVRADIDG